MKFLLRFPLHPSLPSSSSNLFSEHRQLSTFCLLALYLTNADPQIILQGRQALLIPQYSEEAGPAGEETCSTPFVKLGGQLVESIFPPLPPSYVLAVKHFLPVKGNRTGQSSHAKKSGPICCLCRLGSLLLISVLFLFIDTLNLDCPKDLYGVQTESYSLHQGSPIAWLE